MDIGGKRTGLAVTDPFQMIASAIEGCLTKDLLDRLKDLINEEPCAGIVVGDPLTLIMTKSDNSDLVDQMVKKLSNTFPDLNLYMVDERFTSKLASQSLVLSGVPKKRRQDKLLIDSTSAAIILQSYLDKNS